MATRKRVLKDVDCSLISHRPVFSVDSKLLFVICGSLVRVYSTETGQCVHKLEETSRVTSVSINPRNHLQLFVSTKRGLISAWDYTDCVRLKQIQLNTKINALWMPKKDGAAFVVTNDKLLMIDDVFSNDRRQKTIFNRVYDGKSVAIGAAGDFAVKAKGYKLEVHLTTTGETSENYESKKQNYTCVAAHPTEYCVATGDDQGKIFVWYNIHKKEGKYVKKRFHWHQLPVADICFTSTGAHLLSVGGECVMVKWTLHTQSDENKYSPRLGMPMRWVTSSSDSNLVATCHLDNAIHLVSGQGKLLVVIQGITQSYLWRNPPVPTGLIYDPRSESLVLNGKPGHLQFYSLEEDKQLFNLDIGYRNYHHREREFDVILPDVTKAAFDSNGDWLATVEVRDDSETSVDVGLKFWKYSPGSQNYILNTSVELPHSRAVNALVFRPQKELSVKERRLPSCVTTSDDKKYKIWALVPSTDAIGYSQVDWTCESGGYYRQEEAGDATFNDDGSVLAVVFGRAVTLWNPDTNAIQNTLYDPLCHQVVKQVEFGSGPGSTRSLVSITAESMVIWDSVEARIRARVRRNIACLVKDPRSEFMATINDLQELVVFAPDRVETPAYRWKIDKKGIIAGVFIPRPSCDRERRNDKCRWDCETQLYLMDSTMQLFAVVEERKEEEEKIERLPLQRNVPETALGILLGQKLRNESVDGGGQSVDAPIQSVEIDQILSAPSHMLPSAEKVCEILHHHLYLQRRKKENADGVEMEEREDDINVKRKRNDSMSVIEKDSFSIPNFDWLTNVFA